MDNKIGLIVFKDGILLGIFDNEKSLTVFFTISIALSSNDPSHDTSSIFKCARHKRSFLKITLG
jgi:hypothetical protein